MTPLSPPMTHCPPGEWGPSGYIIVLLAKTTRIVFASVFLLVLVSVLVDVCVRPIQIIFVPTLSSYVYPADFQCPFTVFSEQPFTFFQLYVGLSVSLCRSWFLYVCVCI